VPRQAVSTQFARHALIRRDGESGGARVNGGIFELACPQVSAFYLIGHGIGILVPMSHGAMWAGFGFRSAALMLGYMEVVYHMRHGGQWDGCVGLM